MIRIALPPDSHLLEGGLIGSQKALGVLEEAFSSRRESYPLTGSFKEGDLKGLLKGPDLLGDRWLCQEELIGGFAEGASSSGDAEGLQQSKIHGPPSS